MSQLPAGTIHHTLPPAMRRALMEAKLTETWQSLTPLMRNEWICWVESPKRSATRQSHLVRLVEDLAAGKRRPCCWAGCVHRTDKALSPSVQGILARRGRN